MLQRSRGCDIFSRDGSAVHDLLTLFFPKERDASGDGDSVWPFMTARTKASGVTLLLLLIRVDGKGESEASEVQGH